MSGTGDQCQRKAVSAHSRGGAYIVFLNDCILMIAFILTFIGLFAYAFISNIIELFSEVSNWLNEADFEPHEEKIEPYMDNSEYDWGHNIINYMREEQ